MKRGEEDAVDAEELFSHVKEMNALAHFARCQAQEADMRANHAVNMADRAAGEAEAVRQIALSLTKTARSVAKMSLEHIKNMNSVEDRCFKRGSILHPAQEFRKNREKNKTPSPCKLERSWTLSSISEDSASVKADDKMQHQGENSLSEDARGTLENMGDNSPPSSHVCGSQEFVDRCDPELHKEASLTQSSRPSDGQAFIETIPENEESEDLDCGQTLPVVFWDTRARRSVHHKIQKKLRSLEGDRGEQDVPVGEEVLEVEGEGKGEGEAPWKGEKVQEKQEEQTVQG